MNLKITETDKNQYADWYKIFNDSMEDVIDKQAIDDLTGYIEKIDFQAKVNRYGKHEYSSDSK